MKKTAMQMAIDKIQIRLDQYGGDLLPPILSNIKRELEELRDTIEREQIEDTFKQGIYLAMTPSVTPADYYQNTYGNGG